MSIENTPDLDELLGEARGKIDTIDAEILRLLSERSGVVDQVARVKKEHGLPVYHPAREEDLISRRRDDADRLGLNPDMVEDILRTVIRGSRITQTETTGGHAVRPGATVVIVGGLGGMGQCLVKWFDTAGYRVRILDKDDWDNAAALCDGADLAVLSVPIAITGQTAHRLAPHLPADCVLADITSNKSGPVAAMLEAHPGPVVGLHPMFGPGTHALDKQIVVVTGGRGEDECRWVVEQLANWGAVVVTATPEEHDRVMTVVQALRHFATFAFGQFLFNEQVDLARTLEFSSPIYRLEMGMVGRLFAQDPQLYADIIFSTPERRELLCKYAEGLKENIEMLRGDDEKAFKAEFGRIAKWFGPFSDQSIRESGYLIDKMVERF